MALSDLWTQDQLLAACRRELMDPTGTTAWSWGDLELQTYISDWLELLQHRFEFTWGTATILSTGTATITLTNVAADLHRVGNVWWDGFRLHGRTKEELEILVRDWRAAEAGIPQIAYQDSVDTLSVWPVPPSTNTATVVFEFPRSLTISTNTSTMEIPAWTRYSVVNYVAYRAYVRPGPQQNLSKASRYKAKFVKQGIRYRTIWDPRARGLGHHHRQ